MVVAKNPVAAGKWTKLIGSKIVKKEYIALCAGKMPAKNGGGQPQFFVQYV